MKQKKWILAPEDPGAASLLARELHLGTLASRVLAARGFRSAAQAEEFLDAGHGRMSDHFLLKDIIFGDKIPNNTFFFGGNLHNGQESSVCGDCAA